MNVRQALGPIPKYVSPLARVGTTFSYEACFGTARIVHCGVTRIRLYVVFELLLGSPPGRKQGERLHADERRSGVRRQPSRSTRGDECSMV